MSKSSDRARRRERLHSTRAPSGSARTAIFYEENYRQLVGPSATTYATVPEESRPTTLAELLGAPDAPALDFVRLEDIEDAAEFGQAVMNSREFKQYILDGLRYGSTPGFAGILKFFLEHACGKPPEKIELTGKNGGPVEVSEVRRVVVRATGATSYDDAPTSNTTH